MPGAASHHNHSHQLLHGIGALLQRGLLLRGELDLNDLLDAFGAKLHRNANVQASDAILAIEIRGAGENLLLVFQNRFDHLSGCG